MIKITELRLGNLVESNLPQSEELYYVVDLNLLEIFDEVEVDPIVLTEEWKLRFGFTKSISVVNNKPSFTLRMNSDNVLVIDSLGECLWVKEGYIGGLDLNVKYVHQFQNLFFSLVEEEPRFNNKNKPPQQTEDGLHEKTKIKDSE